MIPEWLGLRKDWTWQTVRELQDAGVILVEDGNHGADRPRAGEFTDDGTAFLRAADLSDGRVLFSTSGRISDVALRRIRKGIGKPGDVLFSHKGTVGKLALVPADAPPFVCSPQTTFWRVLDAGQLDRQFLFAYMGAPEFQRQWTVRKGDTDMADYVSLTAQRTLLVPLPAIVTQRKIAAILSTYDDLIENHERRVRLLEEVAQRIYREWFLDFRHPGHDSNSLVDSELGPIPRGWEVTRLARLVDCVRDGVTAGEQTRMQPYVPIDCIARKSLVLREWRNGEGAQSSLIRFREGDILLGAMRPYFHKVAIAPFAGTTRTTCFVLRPRASGSFAFALMTVFDSRTIDYAAAHSSGSTIPYARWDGVLGNMPTLLPPRELLQAFEKAVEPTLAYLARAGALIANLRSTRSLLLPRLISGEIDVSDLDIATPDLAAA